MIQNTTTSSATTGTEPMNGAMPLHSVNLNGLSSARGFDSAMVNIRTACFGESEFAQLKAFLLNDSGPVPGRKAISDLFNLSRDIVQKMALQLRETKVENSKSRIALMEKDDTIEALQKEILSLKEKLKSYEAQPSEEKNLSTSHPQGFSQLRMDSTLIAKALCYRASSSGHAICKKQVQSMLFILYGKTLARDGSRLTIEHPQMWEYGPVFPKAYAAVKGTSDESFKEVSEKLERDSPQISALLDETIARCAWRESRDLTASLLAEGSPCHNAKSRNKEGKKTARMDDTEIRDWFLSRDKKQE